MCSVEGILAEVGRVSGATLEADDDWARLRVGARVVARVDLRKRRVLVEVPPYARSRVRGAFPSSRPTRNGIAFDLAGARDCSEAVRAIRTRVATERMSGQLGSASP